MAAGRQKESDTGHNLSIHKSSVDQAQELKSKSFSDRSNKDFAISLESLMK